MLLCFWAEGALRPILHMHSNAEYTMVFNTAAAAVHKGAASGGFRAHLGLQDADALLLEVMEEALALQEPAGYLHAVLQQPRATGIDNRRECQLLSGACSMLRS